MVGWLGLLGLVSFYFYNYEEIGLNQNPSQNQSVLGAKEINQTINNPLNSETPDIEGENAQQEYQICFGGVCQPIDENGEIIETNSIEETTENTDGSSDEGTEDTEQNNTNTETEDSSSEEQTSNTGNTTPTTPTDPTTPGEDADCVGCNRGDYDNWEEI